ncbi:hypothetical protein [Aquisphaera insulae]|uniref:hypothetical protein n=1 Tax=Aquisphaera insulae TaxID=2712864 RepID=UPI0020306FF0|nr:hypothetical protein [Aquisphaera insulae]
MPTSSKRLMRAVKDVLLRDWDPLDIGAKPHLADEYDRYAAGVCRMLMAGTDERRLAAHLRHIRTVAIGVLLVDEGRDERVARRLLDLPAGLPPMDEEDFWPRLEWSVSGELEQMRDHDLRRFWCDGFLPRTYHLEGPSPRIEGRAWIGDGSTQDEWAFTLLLPHPFGSREEIPWESLVPAGGMTRWLTLDRSGKRIQIEPTAAVPDPA